MEENSESINEPMATLRLLIKKYSFKAVSRALSVIASAEPVDLTVHINRIIAQPKWGTNTKAVTIYSAQEIANYLPEIELPGTLMRLRGSLAQLGKVLRDDPSTLVTDYERYAYTNIGVLGLSTRTMNALQKMRILTLGHLYLYGEKDLRKIRDLGKGSISDLRECLAAAGYPPLDIERKVLKTEP